MRRTAVLYYLARARYILATSRVQHPHSSQAYVTEENDVIRCTKNTFNFQLSTVGTNELVASRRSHTVVNRGSRKDPTSICNALQ